MISINLFQFLINGDFMLKLLLLLDFFFLIYLLLNRDKNKKKFIIGIILFFIVLFLVSISFLPDNSYDISVYYKQMDLFRENGLIAGYINSQYIDYPIIALYFAFCSFFPNCFLSGFTSIIIYGIIVFLLTKSVLKLKSEYFIIILYILISINYLSVINGIRNTLCYSLMALSIYWMNNGNNRRSVFFIILSIGIHSSSILLLSLYIIGKRMKLKHLLIILIIIVFLNTFPNALLFFESAPFFGSLFYRFRIYLADSLSINSILIYNISLLIFGMVLFTFYVKKNTKISFEVFKCIILTFPIFLLFGNSIVGRVISFVPFFYLSLIPYFVEKRELSIQVSYLVFLYLILAFLFVCYISYSSITFGGFLWI